MKSASYLCKMCVPVKIKTSAENWYIYFIILKVHKAENFTEIKNQLMFCQERVCVGGGF